MNKTLFILFFTLLLDTITIGILIPFIPALFTDVDSPIFLLADYSERGRYVVVGAIGAVFGLMQFFTAPVLGELSDIYGRRRLLLVCVGLLALANILFGLGIALSILAVLLVSRAMAGMAGANFSIVQAGIADITTPENRAKNFGLIGAAFVLGFIIGPSLGAGIATLSGSSAVPFFVAGGFGLLNTLFVYIFIKDTRRISAIEKKKFTLLKGIMNIRFAMRDVEMRPVYLTSFLFVSGFTFFTTFISILLSSKHGLSEGGVGFYFTLVGIVVAFTQLVVLRFLTKYWSERKILTLALPVLSVCIVLYPLMPSVAAVYLLAIPTALSDGLVFANVSALISKMSPADKQGLALGINGSLMALAQGFIPLLAGLVTSFSGLAFPFVCGGVAVLLAVLMLRNVKVG
jgi:DHA1 family tetracycline resistance protein-like MFS transporter